MQRSQTIKEKIANYPWLDENKELKEYFESLTQNQFDLILAHYKLTDCNTLPIQEVISSALSLKKILYSESMESRVNRLYEALKIANIEIETPDAIKNNILNKTLKYLRQEKCDQDLTLILQFSAVNFSAIDEYIKATICLQFNATALEVEMKRLINETYKKQLLLPELEKNFTIITQGKHDKKNITEMKGYINFLKRLDPILKISIPTFFYKYLKNNHELEERKTISNKIKIYLLTQHLPEVECNQLQADIYTALGEEKKETLQKRIREEINRAREVTNNSIHKKIQIFISALQNWETSNSDLLTDLPITKKIATLAEKHTLLFGEILKIPQPKKTSSGDLVTWTRDHINTLFSVLIPPSITSQKSAKLCQWQTLAREAARKKERRGTVYELINADIPVRQKNDSIYHNPHSDFMRLLQENFTEQELTKLSQSTRRYSSTSSSLVTASSSASSSFERHISSTSSLSSSFDAGEQSKYTWDDFGELMDIIDDSSDEDDDEPAHEPHQRDYDSYLDSESYVDRLSYTSKASSSSSSSSSSSNSSSCFSSRLTSIPPTSTKLIIDQLNHDTKVNFLTDILSYYQIKDGNPKVDEFIQLNLPDHSLIKIRNLLKSKINYQAATKTIFEKIATSPQIIKALTTIMLELRGRLCATFLMNQMNPSSYYLCIQKIIETQNMRTLSHESLVHGDLNELLIATVNALATICQLAPEDNATALAHMNVTIFVRETQAAINKWLKLSPTLEEEMLSIVKDFRDKAIFFLAEECLFNCSNRRTSNNHSSLDGQLKSIQELIDPSEATVSHISIPLITSMKSALSSVLRQEQHQEQAPAEKAVLIRIPDKKIPHLEKLLKLAGILPGFQDYSSLTKTKNKNNESKLIEIEELLVVLGQTLRLETEVSVLCTNSKIKLEKIKLRQETILSLKKGEELTVATNIDLRTFIDSIERNIAQTRMPDFSDLQAANKHLASLNKFSKYFFTLTREDQQAVTELLHYCAAFAPNLRFSQDIYDGMIAHCSESIKLKAEITQVNLVIAVLNNLSVPRQQQLRYLGNKGAQTEITPSTQKKVPDIAYAQR